MTALPVETDPARIDVQLTTSDDGCSVTVVGDTREGAREISGVHNIAAATGNTTGRKIPATTDAPTATLLIP